jgi:hypothetical protein
MRMASPSPICSVAANHRCGEKQQPGTDLKMAGFRSVKIDVETNFAFIHVEADHSSI